MAVPFARDARAGSWLGEVSYNGIRFPPALKSQVKFEPVYDASNRVMKYMKASLHIEAYLFPGVLEQTTTSPDAIAKLPYEVASAVESSTEFLAGKTTDVTMVEVAHRLSEPCQRLSFTYQGAGNILLNDANSPYDVDNGPKPKVTDWKPLTNKMAKVAWDCEACFSPCSSTNSAGLVSYVAEFPFTVNTSIAENGSTVRIISGSYEVALTRFPNPTTANPPRGEHHAGVSRPFELNDSELFINARFPVMKQFMRKQEFILSNDRKTVDFTLTDTEIQSDEAFGIGCVNENVRLSTAGALNAGGFRKWGTSLSGNIELLAGYPKSYAIAEMGRLFDKFYTQSVTKGKQGPLQVVTSARESDPATNENDKSYGILRSIRFSDEIFGRTVDFTFNWDVFTSLETLFDATGIFKPVRKTNSDQNKAWGEWAVSMSEVVDTGFQDLRFNENDDIIVSLCIPLIQGPASSGRVPSTTPDYRVKDKKVKGDDTSDKEKKEAAGTYSHYETQFGVEVEHHTLRHRPLKGIPAYQEQALPNLKQSTQLEFQPPSSTNTASLAPDIFHKIRETSYTLVFSGMAVRLEYPVPVPHIASYGGQPVTRVGEDIILPRKLGNGLDVVTGKSYTLHGLIWQKRYALPLPPSGAVIDSDGHSAIYV